MKRCQAIIKPVNSFNTRKCVKKAVLYLKDLSGNPIGLKELYLCSEHSNVILKQIIKLSKEKKGANPSQ